MLSYPELNHRWIHATSKKDIKDIEDYLIGIWLDEYYRIVDSAHTDVVETRNTDFSYLFDIFQERLIAAWGISKGKSDELRDKSRMRGYPLSAGNKYHRGHAIPHSLGGGTDINLVAQIASINTGAFRVLEIKAVNTPGALYFTYWEYQNLNTQIPTGVQQGLLSPGQNADLRWFAN
jgi:hypothetical protein